MEAIRSGDSLSALLAGASKHNGEFTGSDRVVTFLLEAKKKE